MILSFLLRCKTADYGTQSVIKFHCFIQNTISRSLKLSNYDLLTYHIFCIFWGILDSSQTISEGFRKKTILKYTEIPNTKKGIRRYPTLREAFPFLS